MDKTFLLLLYLTGVLSGYWLAFVIIRLYIV
ncbi:putative membrane protein [Enterobacter sp. J49]|nr:putative membrane protein [Enterobacter sp. J49]